MMNLYAGGIFGSAPLSNVSAALGDIYEPRARGMAVTFYTLMVIGGRCWISVVQNRPAKRQSLGSSVGPIIGSALISDKSLGWRCSYMSVSLWRSLICSRDRVHHRHHRLCSGGSELLCASGNIRSSHPQTQSQTAAQRSE